jgi:hypothetical protein
MKKIGIWMDKKHATIISIVNNEEQVHEIQSNIEDYHVRGGSGTRMKGGPQDVVQDSKYLETEKNQYRLYFKNLIPFIEGADQIVIFGPAQAGSKFVKVLSEKYHHLYRKVEGVEKSDKMTINQRKAWVREYFEMHLSE